MKEPQEPFDGFHSLLRAHDFIWNDRASWTFQVRMRTCQTLWERAIKVAEDRARGRQEPHA